MITKLLCAIGLHRYRHWYSIETESYLRVCTNCLREWIRIGRYWGRTLKTSDGVELSELDPK